MNIQQSRQAITTLLDRIEQEKQTILELVFAELEAKDIKKAWKTLLVLRESLTYDEVCYLPDLEWQPHTTCATLPPDPVKSDCSVNVCLLFDTPPAKATLRWGILASQYRN